MLRVTAYERLGEYREAFAEGGTFISSSWSAREGRLKAAQCVRCWVAKTCWIEGNATPFGMYVKLYRHRDQFVVIDDVDALYADRSGVRLLKCLCQRKRPESRRGRRQRKKALRKQISN